MSSTRVNGVCTPAMWFSSTLRTSPWHERSCLVSPLRSTFTVSPSTTTLTDAGAANFTEPLGPLTVTRPDASEATVTPLASFSGFNPMRDIAVSLASGDAAEYLAARVALARLAVGDHSAVRGEHEDPLARRGRGQFRGAAVDAAPRLADARDLPDDVLAVRAVLQRDAQDAARARVDHPVVGDEAFALQDLRDAELQPRPRDVHVALTDRVRVADPGQHVGDGVCHAHVAAPSLTRTPSSHRGSRRGGPCFGSRCGRS